MIYTKTVNKALKLCFEIHKDQFDKSEIPYVFHPFYLASQFDNEDLVVIALLHDVIEDSDLTLEDLVEYGFDEKVIAAIDVLTHKKGYSYMEYIRLIKTNELAKQVKLVDLTHNSDLNRLEVVSDKDLKRIEKYQKAIKELTN